MRLTRSDQFAAPPSRVGEVLCGERFNLEAEQLRGGLEVRYRLLERTPERMVYEVETVMYRRKLTGIDRSATERGTTHSTYEIPAGLVRWRFRGEGLAARVEVRGETRLEAAGGGTRLVQQMDVEVRIPLIGGQVARLASRELESAQESRIRLLERHLAEA